MRRLLRLPLRLLRLFWFFSSSFGPEANKPLIAATIFANSEGPSDLRSTGAGAAVGIDSDTAALSITCSDVTAAVSMLRETSDSSGTNASSCASWNFAKL